MVDSKTFKQLALGFPDAVEAPHFERAAFKFKGKRIFATLAPDGGQATLKLSEVDQSVFCAFDKNIIYPVNNKWGKQGWTIVELKKVRKDMLKDMLSQAYQHVASKK